MQERQFKVHVGRSILLKMSEGSRPEFELAKYDSQGGMVQAKAVKKKVTTADGKTEEVEVAPEAEQSFLQKYWMYLLIGWLMI